MNIIYITFIVIIFFSLITGLIVTVIENKEKKKYNELLENKSLDDEEILDFDNSNVDNDDLIQSSINNVQEENAFSVSNPVPIVQNTLNMESSVIQNNSVNNYIAVPEIQSSEEVSQVPVVENSVSNHIESTFKVDNIKKLENTLELKVNNSSSQFYDIPQLSPYSVVDDDVI